MEISGGPVSLASTGFINNVHVQHCWSREGKHNRGQYLCAIAKAVKVIVLLVVGAFVGLGQLDSNKAAFKNK